MLIIEKVLGTTALLGIVSLTFKDNAWAFLIGLCGLFSFAQSTFKAQRERGQSFESMHRFLAFLRPEQQGFLMDSSVQ